MLDFSDLSPFAADMTQEQARLVIEDVEAELARIAPTLVDFADPTVVRICRTAALRYFDYLKSGGRRTTLRMRVRGPFEERDQVSPTDQGASSNTDIFTAVEIQSLHEVADTATPTPTVASPVGAFPLPESYRYPLGAPVGTDYTYPPTGGIGWLGR